MNKKILKKISFLLIFLISIDSYSQCDTEIRAVRDTIACGESVLLTNITLSNSPTSDNFSGNTLGGLWASPGSVSAGWTLNSICGLSPTGQNLWFAQGAAIPRRATTTNIDASCGGTIAFDFRMETPELYRTARSSFYEFKPKYKGYNFILPKRNINKILKKFKFALAKS